MLFSVLFSVLTSDYAAANREVVRLIAAKPERFFGFAFVHAVRDKGRILPMVRQAVEEFGFVGIKAHLHDAPISREICEAACAFSLPVLYDVTGEVAVCELLAEKYPDVNFIIPHLGSFSDDWRAQLALIDHLAHHPNIHTDTAGVRRFDLLAEAARRAGAEKSSSAPTALGCIRAWNWPRFMLWGCRLRTRPLFLAATCSD